MEDYKKRVLLLMNYDNRKTLTENTEKILLESAGEGLVKILRGLLSFGDETLGKVIGKTEPEIQAFARKTRYTADEIDNLFNSIKNNKLLAEELFKDFALLSSTQLDNTVNTLVTEVVANPKGYRRIVDTFVDNYMLHLDLPESAKSLITEYANIVSSKVKDKLKLNHKSIYDIIFPKIGGVVKKLSKAEAEKLNPKTIKWWERVLSTDLTISDLIKGLIDDFVNRMILKRSGSQQYVNDLISKLQKSLNDSLEYRRGDKGDITQLRNINTMIRVLEQKYKIDSDAFYDGIEQVLKRKYPDNSYEVRDLIEQVKKQNPFTTGRAGALTEFFNNTASSKYIRSLRKSIFGSEKSKNFKEFCERTLSLLAVGSPKTKAEFAEYFSKGSPGVRQLWIDLNIAMHVGMPIFLTTIGTLFNVLNMSIFGNDTETKNIWGDFKQRWYTRYRNMLDLWGALGVVLPVHPYGYNIGESMLETAQDIYDNKFSIKKLVLEHNLNGLSDDELSRFDGYDPSKSKKENIKAILNAANPNDGYDIIEPDNGGGNVAPGGETNGGGNVAPGGETNGGGNVAPGGDDETVPGSE